MTNVEHVVEVIAATTESTANAQGLIEQATILIGQASGQLMAVGEGSPDLTDMANRAASIQQVLSGALGELVLLDGQAAEYLSRLTGHGVSSAADHMPAAPARSGTSGMAGGSTPRSETKRPREMKLYDKNEVAWTAEQMEEKVASGAASFIRRIRLNFLTDEPGDENLTMDDIVDLGVKAREDLRAILGVDVLEPEAWGFARIDEEASRYYVEKPRKLPAQDHALVAEVPTVKGCRPLTTEEAAIVEERLDKYMRINNHPSGCRFYDLRSTQFAVAPPDATHDKERIVLLDCDLLFERDSWITY